MGIFTSGKLLNWQDIEPELEEIKANLALDFVGFFKTLDTSKRNVSCNYAFGEELEYSLIKFNSPRTISCVYTQASGILEKLNKLESSSLSNLFL